MRVGGVWVQLLGGQGACACVILVFRECIWNAPSLSLVLPAFVDTDSLGGLSSWFYGSTLGDCLLFPCGE